MKNPNRLALCSTILPALIAGLVGGGVGGYLAGYWAFRASPVASNDSSVSKLAPTSVPEVAPVVSAIRKVRPSVVAIQNYQAPGPGQPDGAVAPAAFGSGLVFDRSGLIVTNNHVVEGARLLQVFFADGTSAEGTLLGADPTADIAVVKVNGPLPPAVPLEPSGELELGETAIAIGSPLDQYRGSATVGVVSGLNRTVGGMGGLIQTDAALNAGDSGGPLIDTAGRVIGINTLVVRTTTDGRPMEGLGFAVPANRVQQIVTRLLVRRDAEPAYIGIQYTEVENLGSVLGHMWTSAGVFVIQVDAGSPADLAGVQTKDIILEVDGQGINRDHVLPSLLRGYQPGDTVTLTVGRAHRQLHIPLTVGCRPS